MPLIRQNGANMKVIDMHCDTISCLLEQKRNGTYEGLRKNHLHIDVEKLKHSNYLVQNFALFVYLQEGMNPLEDALQMTDIFYQELEENKDSIALALTYDDICKNERDGKISALLTLEEGGMLKGELSYLRTLYRLGARMMTLTWNFKNELGHPNFSYFPPKEPDMTCPNTTDGVTELGFAFLQEMERLGMIIDVSHLSDAGFYDIYEHTKKPFVASHSNARTICNNVRNLTDDMIIKLSNRGGVTGMNFCPDFLTSPTEKEKNPGTIDAIVSHVKHIVNTGGSECVGLGSDFDGINGHAELQDASAMDKLEAALKKNGFTSNQIDGFFYKNVLRVYQEILK